MKMLQYLTVSLYMYLLVSQMATMPCGDLGVFMMTTDRQMTDRQSETDDRRQTTDKIDSFTPCACAQGNDHADTYVYV